MKTIPMQTVVPTAVAVAVAVAVTMASVGGQAATIEQDLVEAELPPGQAPNYAVGDRSVWLDEERGETTFEITSVDDGIVSWLREDGCSWKTLSESTYAPFLRWTKCSGSSGTQKIKRKGKAKIYPLEVEKSEKWRVRGRNNKGVNWSTTRNCKVKGTADVTVPAGTFDTYQVLCTNEWTRFKWYFSPELRFPVLYSRVPRAGSSGSRMHIELISYSPAN